ncbi:MAG TPA: DnaJ C-terminal domain-containing protein [Zoogloea sp.]|uniref:DnaJ C-terminal domain-containing protein n=1 Tax=Zoogloea sp. TaxID=49181 RepID=UPI002C38C3DD|nr:DnaJ C-terminal domain-containing protein [Zoogloea sp.]HMV19346.1 DnaJ C-terminal domain-containing protein [Rhodocyclaceae bacterium]HMV64214.1 DnaJ C-terminal domain-containing protein [Rhodocyclaceae bacterium]HMW52831.1 DnaJ C-terminal domain-containing protein [Rhodocyclaceae bacterium]HMZ75965.1 DnaJ C-terminal domain-containing protein [Rhodocyclaceae bacterium]HNA67593.1 DnaJ C-terminal domain-containing protein [Rhodocyclaceae bacterium]
MSADDFHRILGVKPGASAAEIKRAYRRQAMRWHPDRNADPDAHDQFKRIREAFERLSVGASQVDNDGDADTPPPAAPRGEDRRVEVTLDLTEAALGTTVDVTVEGRTSCTACGGSGQRSYGRTTMCGACHGSGRVRSKNGLDNCTQCSGKGYFTDRRCPDCDGRGWHPSERRIEVTVPPALLPGDELRVPGQGGPAPEAGTPGDLYITVRARPHPLFRLDGRNVHLTVPVSVFRLLAGGEILVPTLSGLETVQLPEGAGQPELRVTGHGFPARGKRPAGDLHLHLKTELPAYLSQEQKAMLEMAEQVLLHHLDTQSPALALWKQVLEQHR